MKEVLSISEEKKSVSAIVEKAISYEPVGEEFPRPHYIYIAFMYLSLSVHAF